LRRPLEDTTRQHGEGRAGGNPVSASLGDGVVGKLDPFLGAVQKGYSVDNPFPRGPGSFPTLP